MKASDVATEPKVPTRRSIVDLDSDEAAAFLLKPESYCTIELPEYFTFRNLISNVAEVLATKPLSELGCRARDHERVNHRIVSNKDGLYAWRPLELIHPALYVSLVQRITQAEHWKTLCAKLVKTPTRGKIRCLSLPVESLTKEKDRAAQVVNWLQEVEQRSIQHALDFEYLYRTDITDCYGSIYTHSVAWAIHGKDTAKGKRGEKDLLGNAIDGCLQDMNYGQTNGIPQGSVLMDLVAEIVLSLADELMSERIQEAGLEELLILRYRDDYRIFVNNPADGETVLKWLTEVLIGLGLRLNTSKTGGSSAVITDSVKPDKTAWMSRRRRYADLEKQLLLIHEHAIKYPNAGSTLAALAEYHRGLLRRTVRQPLQLISIVTDIACRNPRTYPYCSAILSKLVGAVGDQQEMSSVLQRIVRRFGRIPNTGHMEIWLQRIGLPFGAELELREPLCQLVQGCQVSIWNSEWISSKDLKKALDVAAVIDREAIQTLDPVISAKEVQLFLSRDPYLA